MEEWTEGKFWKWFFIMTIVVFGLDSCGLM